MTPEQFTQERKYLKNVTPRTLTWYRHSFKAFEGALGDKPRSFDESPRCATEASI